MNIQERINKLGDYFKGMQVNAENSIIYVTVQFQKGWACSEVTEHNFNVKAVQDEIPGVFYFFTDMEIGFDKVFDAIEYNINFNEEAQAKVNLLREKIEELRDIFESEDIDTLKTLEFKYKKKVKKNPKPKKEIIKSAEETEVSSKDNPTSESCDKTSFQNALDILDQQIENNKQ
jgi:hypothetical protein